MLPDLEI